MFGTGSLEAWIMRFIDFSRKDSPWTEKQISFREYTAAILKWKQGSLLMA